MIVYSSTKTDFRDDVKQNRIEDAILAGFRRQFGHGTSAAEVESWKNSMQYMSNVLDDHEIPDDAGVAIEYRIPQTSKRVDFIVTGSGPDRRDAAVIVELKQWSDVDPTDKDAIVSTFVGKAVREVSHPSYQAWTYAALLRDFNEVVQTRKVDLRPCAYLHNLKTDDVIRSPRYAEHLEKAPVFIRSDAQRLGAFIKQHIQHGDNGHLMYEIDGSRIRPSKNLADELVSMLQGNDEFVMIDDQKLVYETALQLARVAGKKKHVLIVEGGPGTGKSVVAVNLLVRLTEERLTTQYVTRNAAPRAVYASVLKGTFRKSHIDNLFSGSGSYTACEPNTFDALIVDEAHRLNEKSGMYSNLGENQIKEIIEAAALSVFFLDQDQRVTWKDIGSVAEIEKWAAACGAGVTRMELQSQFRCNGSDGYLAWLDHVLQIRPTANEDLDGIAYDFRVCDTPGEMMALIEDRNRERNKARAVAGYCWDWISKKAEQSHEHDIVFPEHGFERRWNLDTDGSLWIKKPNSVSEIGCIHTCQGLEVDYVGVIIGPDLVVRDGRVEVHPEARSRMDSTIKGYKKALKADPEDATARVERIIKNTYRTLMSRGQKGCYVWCTDEETREYLREMVGAVRGGFEVVEDDGPVVAAVEGKYPGLNLRVVAGEGTAAEGNLVPIYDLSAAAGGFRGQDVDGPDWVELPEVFRAQADMFVARVVGNSMNRRIPDGAWCLFRRDPGGSREGKIVLVEMRGVADPETGGRYTVKRYRSEKVETEDGWRHGRVVLEPESDDGRYGAIVSSGGEEERLSVLGMFCAVLD